MYRLLFVFYIELRPELGYVPVKSTEYMKGYSLDNLRDLKIMPLLTDNDKNGYFFRESVGMLFGMIYTGKIFDGIDFKYNQFEKPFNISPLKSHLFDPKLTEVFNSVKIRNHVWQRVIMLMSLSRAGKGKKRRGWISYSNLGINQLGAVYEALLSFRGFIARETLYEVKKEGENPSGLEND